MKKDLNFIVTQDDATKEVLLQNGFVLIASLDHLYTFLNEPRKCEKLSFENLKVTFTNKLYF